VGSLNGAGVDELRRADLEHKLFLRMWKLLEDVLPFVKLVLLKLQLLHELQKFRFQLQQISP
jgi:hypothetical protein